MTLTKAKKAKARKMLFKLATSDERLELILLHYESMQREIDKVLNTVDIFSTKSTDLSKDFTKVTAYVDKAISELQENREEFEKRYGGLLTKSDKDFGVRIDDILGQLRTIFAWQKLFEKTNKEKSEGSLKGLEKKFLKKFEEMSTDFQNLRNVKPQYWGGSSRMIYLNSTGGIGNPASPQNLYSDINLIAGAGISFLVENNSTGSWVDITISATGGSGGSTLGFEIPTGTIDGNNAVFTVTHVPLYIVLNGATYFENDGYTLSGFTVTMLIVPETGSTLRSAFNS